MKMGLFFQQLDKVPSFVHDPAWLKRANDHVKYTPDMGGLQMTTLQPLFVYDDIMQGRRQYDMIRDASVRICQAFTVDGFSLWKSKLGAESFPIPLDTSYTGAPKGRIKGELHLIRPYKFPFLDTDKENGVQFLRKRIKLVIPHRELLVGMVNGEEKSVLTEEKTYIMRAWMYVGVTNYWEPLLDGGYSFSPVRRFMSQKITNIALQQYYYWSRLELENS